MPVRFMTAGESHGRALIGIIEGVPAGVPLEASFIDGELKRRQGGYGRGGRMRIESDRVRIVSGVRWGTTMGSPIALEVENRDWDNWREGMSEDAVHAGSIDAVTRPRPGHADLAGALKYGVKDVRNILERSSARETAMRVAVGAVAKRLLAEFAIQVGSYVTAVGGITCEAKGDHAELFKRAEASELRCPDARATDQMKRRIDEAREKGDSVGGIFRVFVIGLPPGLGSHVQWDRRLDGRIAQAVMSVQAIKGIEVGLGFASAEKFGSEVMDEITGSGKGRQSGPFTRLGNNSGGIEGGMTNGMPVVITAVMKPIPTQAKPLRSVDIATGKEVQAAYERSDICAVPAAGVVGECMVALVVADAFMEKFGGDSLDETKRNYTTYIESIRNF